MIFKLIIVQLLLSFNTTNTVLVTSKAEKGIYQVEKNSTFHGKNLEAVYKITYKSTTTNKIRFFEVIKSDNQIRNYFLAEFLLVEKVKNNQGIICYPTGWESVKFIKESELKETCQLIVSGKIPSESMQ